MNQRTVNARQLEVLGWIVDGCPDGVMTDDSHKTSAIALRNRRLVTVSKKGGIRRAEPTDAGRYFVDHLAYPEGHWSASKGTLGLSEPKPHTGRRTEPMVTGKRPVEQMIEDLVTADGRLPISTRDEHRYRTMIRAAERYGKLPDGKVVLVKPGTSYAERILVLEDQPAWMAIEASNVPVPDRLRSPHPTVRQLRDDKTRLRMKQPDRTRALRILDALAKEAVRRGHGVSGNQQSRQEDARPGLLVFVIGGHSHAIDVDELNDRVPHVPTATELRESERYSWKRIPEYDQVPSGRLRIPILGYGGGTSNFADTKTMTLESRLPAVLRELEQRAAQDEERHLASLRRQEERQRHWEAVRDRAIEKARTHHRASHLLDQANRWHERRRVGEYLDALAERVESLSGEEKGRAEEWLSWCREFAKGLDPLVKVLAIPAGPEMTPETIKPFMEGLSPYGSDRW